jgi:hypothetical protein
LLPDEPIEVLKVQPIQDGSVSVSALVRGVDFLELVVTVVLNTKKLVEYGLTPVLTESE